MTTRRTGTAGTPARSSVAPPPGFGPLLTPGHPGTRRAGPRSGLALVSVWAVTRLAMLALLVRDDLGVGGVSREVYVLYRGWSEQLGRGAFPADDSAWQYPPGAGAVILSPALLPWLTYFQAFVALALLADAVIAFALARAGRTDASDRAAPDQDPSPAETSVDPGAGTGIEARPGRGAGPAGAWLWVCGLPLLLHIPLARYDVQVTALAVLALLAVRRHPRAGGALAGLGALVKGWPLLTLLGTPRGRTTRASWAAAAVAAAALLGVLALGHTHALAFLGRQRHRGVQIESLGGTALAVARLAGWPGTVEYRYGAFEFTGPYVSSVARISLLLTAAACCWLLLWRLRARRWSPATPFDAALAAVLLFTVTSRVISPQYLVWLLGLGAVCLTSRHTRQRTVALLLLPATALSALAYPVLYEEVVAGTAVGVALMVVRNGLLLAAALLACRALWAGTRPDRRTG
ncbi:glycosyltransferase 87 family protein [Streptomyces liangshanensis]|uniref:glycosyltransferase 87 family protein n=1 Tax=Streptomyces liangshanensis TaxID=2717324 RepID=UPI0036DB401A